MLEFNDKKNKPNNFNKNVDKDTSTHRTSMGKIR